MDILTNKGSKEYDTLSRFTSFPTYYNTKDKKYMYGLMTQMNTDKQYTIHKITDSDTLESLAFKYYGRPDYYWVIAMFNNINDCFSDLSENYKTVKIPTISNISFKVKG